MNEPDDEPTLIEQLRKLDGTSDLTAALDLAHEAAAELGDWEQAFALYWSANQRATGLYRAARPDERMTLPDQGKMIAWLCDEIERLRRHLDTRSRP